VAETVKYVRSSIRMCFEPDEPFAFMRVPEADGGGERVLLVAGGGGAGVGVVDDGLSGDKRRSGES
jgi:hypothetical protein